MKRLGISILSLFILFGVAGLANAQLGQTASPLAVAVVVSVVDGDTYDVEYIRGGAGLPTRIEPYLVDTPGFSPGGAFSPGSADCYGVEAKDFAEQMLVGRTVWLSHQGEIRTQNFIERLRVFAYLDSERQAFWQAMLLSQGMARVMVEFPEETPFLNASLLNESEARAARRGLWEACA